MNRKSNIKGDLEFMHIGKQIKEKRLELDMTQNELAEALNVSRSTVSNWEIERNYPDIKLVVSLSEILDIPLEVLLQEDSDVVQQITNDTNEKKKNKLKLRISYVIILILIIIGPICAYQAVGFSEISHTDQIVSVSKDHNAINIETDLPVYKSLSGYYMDLSPESDDTMQISLTASFDLTMNNKETISIPLGGEFSKIIKINFVSGDKTFQSIVVD